MNALILFAHGARDPRWAEPFQRLQAKLTAARPDVRVGLAFLELMSPQLPELIELWMAEGVDDFVIVPIFLGQGGHVRRDLPALIENLMQTHPQASIRLATAVGEDDGVLGAIAEYCLQQVSAG